MPTVLDPPMTTKDRPRPILAKGSRRLQTARSSRAATRGDAASNSDNGLNLFGQLRPPPIQALRGTAQANTGGAATKNSRTSFNGRWYGCPL